MLTEMPDKKMVNMTINMISIELRFHTISTFLSNYLLLFEYQEIWEYYRHQKHYTFLFLGKLLFKDLQCLAKMGTYFKTA